MAACATASTRLVANPISNFRGPRTLGSLGVSRSSTRTTTTMSTTTVTAFNFTASSTVSSSLATAKTHLNANSRRIVPSLQSKRRGIHQSRAIIGANAILMENWQHSARDSQNSASHHRPLTMLALALGFVASATATTTATHGISGHNAADDKFSGSGGGSPFKKPTTPFVLSKETAEKDVQSVEDNAVTNPYLVSMSAVQGARWTMEDTCVIANGGRFVAVFDGHGGSDVSTTLKDRMFQLYKQELVKKHWENQNTFGALRKEIPAKSSHAAALQRALEQVEEAVLQEDDWVYQGSTAVCVVMHTAKDGRRTLLSANVGDSRAILCRDGKALDLTRDHKPSDEGEMKRIRQMGEDIEWDPYGQVYRVRDLSLSRAIGDRFAKPVVSSEPEIMHFPVSDQEDEFILLASDGLWDVMTSQEVVDFVAENLLPKAEDEESFQLDKRKDMARIIANEALERGTADNVCIIVVWLKNCS